MSPPFPDAATVAPAGGFAGGIAALPRAAGSTADEDEIDVSGFERAVVVSVACIFNYPAPGLPTGHSPTGSRNPLSCTPVAHGNADSTMRRPAIRFFDYARLSADLRSPVSLTPRNRSFHRFSPPRPDFLHSSGLDTLVSERTFTRISNAPGATAGLPESGIASACSRGTAGFPACRARTRNRVTGGSPVARTEQIS